jgi:hypothetical protein
LATCPLQFANWQRRDAFTAREEQLGRSAAGSSKYYRLYLHSGMISLAAMEIRRAGVIGRSFAAALTYVSRLVSPPVPAAHNLGVGLRRPCWGQMCGGMLGAMARTAPTRPATLRSTTKFPNSYAEVIRICLEEETTHHPTPRRQITEFSV